MAADPGLIYDILTDYDSYAEWMPYLSGSRLLAKEGDLAIAEFDMAQPKPQKLTLECIHSRNTMVLGRPISGGLPLQKIQWDISPAGQGQSQLNLTIVARNDWHWILPGSGRYRSAQLCWNALKKHLSAFATDIGVSTADGEKLLELLETDEGPVLWLRGKKYVLREAAK